MMGRLVRGRCPDKPGSRNRWPNNPAFHPSFQGCWSTSTRRGIPCLRTRRGGVNDPAGLPRLASGSTPQVSLAHCAPWEGQGQKPPAQERWPKPRSDGRGVIALWKSRSCHQSSTVGRRGLFCPSGYVDRSEHRLCEPHFQRSTTLSGVRVYAQDYLGAGFSHSATKIKVGAEHPARMSDPLVLQRRFARQGP